MTSTRRSLSSTIAIYLGFVVVLVFFGGPLAWVLSLSLRPSGQLNLLSPSLIPSEPTLASYRAVLGRPEFIGYLWNSLKIATGAGLTTMVVAVPAAYAFSRLTFRGRVPILVGVLALPMISPLIISIPLYRYFARLDMLDSLFITGMVYVAVLTPLATWMVKGYFDSVPRSLEEAALIDGCTRVGALVRVILPVMRTPLMSVFVLMLILGWAQFLLPFILLTESSKFPVSVGLLFFAGSAEQTQTQLVAAASVLAIGPAVLVFTILQRFIIDAFTGSTKG